MTYLGKARELKPELTDKQILKACPYLLKLEPMGSCGRIKCKTCWDREMPVEVKK